MDRVEGLLDGLKLSEEERKGVRIGATKKGSTWVEKMQAIGKLLAEKPAHAEAVEKALGPVWCPMKGVECKDLGENLFLFTFQRAVGRKKAVDSGPWMFDNQLVVMEEYVPSKNLDDYAFSHIPIWVRVFKLPLGCMNRATGEAVGEQLGEYLETGGVEDGMAVGRYLRVKIRLNILKPLRRGTMVEVDESGRTIWCPLEYEYLPDFCYICGIIGHLNKECSIKLKKGEEPQFGKWLKWTPPKRQSFIDNSRRWNEGGARRSYGLGSGGSRSGSDAPSWRNATYSSRQVDQGKGTGEKDGNRPLKITMGDGKEAQGDGNKCEIESGKKGGEGLPRGLEFHDDAPHQDGSGENNQRVKVDEEGKGTEVMDMVVEGGSQKGEKHQEREGMSTEEGEMVMTRHDKEDGEGGGKTPLRKYRRLTRNAKEKGHEIRGNERKRKGHDMEVDGATETKKSKVTTGEAGSGEQNNFHDVAGLSEQLRVSQ
ncbi:hypothetical protein ACQ4PT_001971 [Festuca glaucescens]